jgi:hypothetical protein
MIGRRDRTQAPVGWVVCALALLLCPFASMADAVLDWNELGVTAVVAARQSAPDSARTMAIVHVAMFNAVNAIEPRFRSYGAGVDAPAGASADAAAAAAAHAVLVKLVPDQRHAGGPGRPRSSA